ncbi:MAG TPA: DUF4105 domain-containing protein [Rhodanobacteraceae bacterium]|nr:DUF4105 domain-containing protein [Rhodanobacteraceae bacterium]
MRAGIIRHPGFGIRRCRRLVRCAAILALIAACALSPAVAQDDAATPPASSPIPNPESRIPALQISLLTIGPGPIFWERFGHNAIVVRDRDAGTAIAYNYGIFDFEQKNFLGNFARGNMRYRIAADRLDDDIEMYREESRSIVEQRLDFTPEEAMKLRDFLRWNVRPENAFYRYDYYLANCSTRVRDALDAALGGAIRRDTEGRSSGYTYRMDSLRLMAANPLLMLGIDLGLGPYADQRIDYWQESFVPAVLSRALGEVRVAGTDGIRHPLVAGESTIERGTVPEPPELPPDLRVPFLIAGIVLALALHALARASSRAARAPAALFALAFELFCGLGGFVLLFLWLGTAHVSAWRNENLLLLNPLCLALIPAASTLLRARPRLTRRAAIVAAIVALLAAFALFSKILPWFVQANLHWILLFLPIHLAIALALRPRSGIARQ